MPSGAVQNSSGLEVILASPGHSGTTSLHVALEALGLRTYKSEETLFYFPQYPCDLDALQLASVLHQRDVKAFSPEPFLELHPLLRLLEASPGVKLLATPRPWGRWRRTREAAASRHLLDLLVMVGKNSLLCHWLPLGLIWHQADAGHSFIQGSMTSVLLGECLMHSGFGATAALMARAGACRGTQLTEAMVASEAMYDEYYDHVRSLVPPERLLEFDFSRHGWTELAAFVGRRPPPPGTPFPWVRSGSVLPEYTQMRLFPATWAAFWALMVASVAANWVLSMWALRASHAALDFFSRWRPCKRD